MSSVFKNKPISSKDYLQNEQQSKIKHELINGAIYAMAGASKSHERISVNVLTEFTNHLKNSPCEAFGSDIKVKAGVHFFYPDLMVVCDDKTDNEYYTEYPVIIVEVLSKSTRRVDETTKLMSYINIPSLQEYVMIEQDIVDVQVIRRSEGWLQKHYFLGDAITLQSIGLTLSVEDIYRRVKNEDMAEFLALANSN